MSADSFGSAAIEALQVRVRTGPLFAVDRAGTLVDGAFVTYFGAVRALVACALMCCVVRCQSKGSSTSSGSISSAPTAAARPSPSSTPASSEREVASPPVEQKSVDRKAVVSRIGSASNIAPVPPGASLAPGARPTPEELKLLAEAAAAPAWRPPGVKLGKNPTVKNFEEFWKPFRAALLASDTDAVAKVTRFPFRAGTANGSGSTPPTASSAMPAPDPETARALREAQELVESMRNQQTQAAESESAQVPARLLGSFSQEDVARAAGAGLDPALHWRAADWHGRKDTIVALAFRPVEFGARAEALEPRLVVLQGHAGKLRLVAEKKVELSHVECPNESGEPSGGDDRAPEISLDLGAYTITPGQTAIGVRFTCAKTFPAAEGIETRLLLLELHGGALRQVFDEKISSINHDRPTGDTTTITGLLSVQGQQHAGYFDLALRLKTKTEGSDPETLPKTTRQPTASTEMTRFVWTGERYAVATGR
jgi:hypothetical protein